MARRLRNGLRCCALDSNGKKCSRFATHLENYHGDNELYDHWSGMPTWVRIPLCDKHRCEVTHD